MDKHRPVPARADPPGLALCSHLARHLWGAIPEKPFFSPPGARVGLVLALTGLYERPSLQLQALIVERVA